MVACPWISAYGPIAPEFIATLLSIPKLTTYTHSHICRGRHPASSIIGCLSNNAPLPPSPNVPRTFVILQDYLHSICGVRCSLSLPSPPAATADTHTEEVHRYCTDWLTVIRILSLSYRSCICPPSCYCCCCWLCAPLDLLIKSIPRWRRPTTTRWVAGVSCVSWSADKWGQDGGRWLVSHHTFIGTSFLFLCHLSPESQ